MILRVLIEVPPLKCEEEPVERQQHQQQQEGQQEQQRADWEFEACSS